MRQNMLVQSCNGVRDRVYFGFTSEETHRAILHNFIFRVSFPACAAWTKRLAGIWRQLGQYTLLHSRSDQHTKYYKADPGLVIRHAPHRRIESQSAFSSYAASGERCDVYGDRLSEFNRAAAGDRKTALGFHPQTCGPSAAWHRLLAGGQNLFS